MEFEYTSQNGVGYFSFEAYNGAMDLDHCKAFLEHYQEAVDDPTTKIIVLTGGKDFFSNGIDLNSIHKRYNPTILAYKNLKAVNRIVEAVLNTSNKLTIAALRGSLAAGGVMLALAADLRYARQSVVFNPSYVNMGLSGSEYWSILLPSMIGYGKTQQLVYEASPISTQNAKEIGLIHDIFDNDLKRFMEIVTAKAEYLAENNLNARLAVKSVLNKRLLKDTHDQVLFELDRMKDCCNHEEFTKARTGFVEKSADGTTPFLNIDTTNPIHNSQ